MLSNRWKGGAGRRKSLFAASVTQNSCFLLSTVGLSYNSNCNCYEREIQKLQHKLIAQQKHFCLIHSQYKTFIHANMYHKKVRSNLCNLISFLSLAFLLLNKNTESKRTCNMLRKKEKTTELLSPLRIRKYVCLPFINFTSI